MSELGREVLILFSGALLCNCIPHLASGLRGERFPTPFTMLSATRTSSPLQNFLWGATNLSVGLTILMRRLIGLNVPPKFYLLLTGFVIAGIILSRHFGRLNKTSSLAQQKADHPRRENPSLLKM
ncbi:hypothetical protein [Granulicella sp. dw_53]|uniref:hypothetical protein n=1 Tax=Granulicella sp. dw_53 TaxID=2719792 RepID=UPI001BD418B3|nr:hypothetical protein [Granulicella sp. dw_53]